MPHIRLRLRLPCRLCGSGSIVTVKVEPIRPFSTDMRSFKFSLRWLLGAVSFAAVGCGLLIYATPLLSKLTLTVAIFGLMAGVVAAVYRAGERRAYWAGFAAFGLGYLWMTFGSWQSPDGSVPLREALVTTELLNWCYNLLPARQTTVTSIIDPLTGVTPYGYVDVSGTITTGGMPTGMTSTYSAGPMTPPGAVFSGTMTTTTSAVNRGDFFNVGHSLWAIVLATLGGLIARRLCRGHQTRGTESGPNVFGVSGAGSRNVVGAADDGTAVGKERNCVAVDFQA